MTGPVGGENLGGYYRRMERAVDTLAQGLVATGFEVATVEAESVEEGIVLSALATIRELAGMLHLIPGMGWSIEARHLARGMVIDYSPMTRLGGDEPQQLVVDFVEPGEDGMVVIHAEGGWTAPPICSDFRFDLVNEAQSALEAAIVGAERHRLGEVDDLEARRLQRLRNCARRFR